MNSPIKQTTESNKTIPINNKPTINSNINKETKTTTKTTTQPKIKDLIQRLKTINQNKTTPKTSPQTPSNIVQTLRQNYTTNGTPSTPKPPTIQVPKLPNTPKLPTVPVPKLLIKTPCSQKRKLSYDMELETPNSHSKTRLLNAPVSKGDDSSAKHDFQERTKLKLSKSLWKLFFSGEIFSKTLYYPRS